MEFQKIFETLEERAPEALAEPWDNPGLMLGRRKQEISSLYLCLDVTREVIRDAVQKGASAIVSHHPLIFKPLSHVSSEDVPGEKLLTLAEHHIPVYSMHTNYDSCKNGMGDQVCRRLGLKKLGVLLPREGQPSMAEGAGESGGETQGTEGKERGTKGNGLGIGFLTELPEEMETAAFAALVKKKFALPFLEIYPGKERVKRIACCPGSGRSEMEAVLRAGADTYLTGDIGHHEGIDYRERGISVLNAGHYGLEHIFMEDLESYLRGHFPELRIFREKIDFPSRIL